MVFNLRLLECATIKILVRTNNLGKQAVSMERHSCLIRSLGMMTFQARLYATEFPLYLVCFTSVIIVSYIVTRFRYPIIILKV